MDTYNLGWLTGMDDRKLLGCRGLGGQGSAPHVLGLYVMVLRRDGPREEGKKSAWGDWLLWAVVPVQVINAKARQRSAGLKK